MSTSMRAMAARDVLAAGVCTTGFKGRALANAGWPITVPATVSLRKSRRFMRQILSTKVGCRIVSGGQTDFDQSFASLPGRGSSMGVERGVRSAFAQALRGDGLRMAWLAEAHAAGLQA